MSGLSFVTAGTLEPRWDGTVGLSEMSDENCALIKTQCVQEPLS